MAFAKKTWKDRIAEFPTRRRLTKEDNTSELVTVAREEGTLSQEGDAFSAENMNDLESRIDAEFTEVNGKLDTATEAIVHDNITGIFTYTKIGHMCIGCGTLITTNDIYAYSAIVSNLPQTYTGNPYPGAFVAEDNTYNDFYINGSAIVNRKPVSKGHTLRLSCIYMCQ